MIEGLGLLARAGDGWSGHMMGVSPTLGLAFNWYSGISQSAMSEFLAMGGYAWYVWMSYGAVALVVAAEIVATRARLRRARSHAPPILFRCPKDP